jgi:ligand-binding sensor domain-containing protein/signal transduction histidine kinase
MDRTVSFLPRHCRIHLGPVALACLMLGAVTGARAERVKLRLPDYQKQNWQVEDGLPENNVRMIGQRADGRLVLATSSGLATFDGLHFQEFAVSGSSDGEAVNAFLEEKDGTLWIGTDGNGVLRYTPSSGLTNISELADRPNERIRNFFRDSSGALWIATQNGIERYRDGRLEVFASAGMISGDITTPFAEDEQGGIFFITSKGLFHFANQQWKPYVTRNAALGRAVAVYRDPQHRLWVGTTKGVLQLLPRKRGGYDEVVRARVATGVTVMTGDAQGNLWVGTLHAGVRRIDELGVDSWTSRDGLADDSICSMFVDSAQDLWIGTQTGGLTRWRNGAFASYHGIRGSPAIIAANVFSDSRGDLWLGTWGEGLFRIHNGQLLNATPTGMPVATSIRALAENRAGQVWIGTWFDGVYSYDGNSYHHYLLGTESPGNAVSSILVDRRGGLWIGTYIGLLYFPDGNPQGKRSLFLGSKLITCLLEDRDSSILVGTTTGLFRVRERQAMPIVNLPHPHILSLANDSAGYTWVSTKAGGLAALRSDRVEQLNAKSGLSGVLVQTIIEDRDGDLWLGTVSGIVKTKIAALHQIADGRQASVTPVFFGREDGLESSECVGTSLPAATRTRDGTLWFVTAKGFVRTTDAAENLVVQGGVTPEVGWSLSDAPDQASAHSTSRIVLAPSQPDLTFQFNVVDVSNPSQLEFRYRLAGYDPDWISSRGRSARYRRLPAGNYQFLLQARRSGEPWGSAITSLDVHQKNHFYQTWYAYLGMLLVAGSLAVLFFRQRLQLAKGQIGIVLEERSRIARECHDTLMAGLAAVSWQLEATSALFRNAALTDSPPSKSCEVARGMISHCQAEARRIIWDLRDTEEMTSLLSRALSRMISAHDPGNSVSIELSAEGTEVPLAPACIHHLVCIAQEAVSNALRHSSASLIRLALRYDSNELDLVISDNGCGLRSAANMAGHFGIPVMEERARKLGGVLRVQNAYSGGTEVSVSVPFHSLETVQPHSVRGDAGLRLEGRASG